VLLAALHFARHPARTKWAERFERGMIGSRLQKAQRFLDEIAAFAREP
jgi:phage gp46-like protein